MKLRPFFLLCLFFAPAFSAEVALANPWRCADGTYTNNPERAATCESVSGTRVCGTSGNKYFAPGRPGQHPESAEACPVTGKVSSPFVDLSAGPAKTSRDSTRRESSHGSAHSVSNNLGPDIAEVFSCVSSVIGGGSDNCEGAAISLLKTVQSD